MTQIIAVANQKGGVGKTTTARNLGAGLKDRGYKVLMLDLDPQGSLTTYFGIMPWEVEKGVAELLSLIIERKAVSAELLAEYIISIDDVDLLPTNALLATIEQKLVVATRREYVLLKLLNLIKGLRFYDYIVIDVLPSLGTLLLNAFTAADLLVIPINPKYLDMQGFELLAESIELAQQETNKNLKVSGILITMFDSRLKLANLIKDTIMNDYGDRFNIYPTGISVSTKLGESSLVGKSIFDYDGNCKSALEYGQFVDDFLRLKSEVK